MDYRNSSLRVYTLRDAFRGPIYPSSVLLDRKQSDTGTSTVTLLVQKGNSWVKNGETLLLPQRTFARIYQAPPQSNP